MHFLISLVDFVGQKTQYVQKKRTIYPEWNTCFDAHIYEGRVINMIVNEKPNRMLAEVTISARALADKCRDGSISTSWVRPRGHCNTAYRYSQCTESTLLHLGNPHCIGSSTLYKPVLRKEKNTTRL